jgi:hypothetical protein
MTSRHLNLIAEELLESRVDHSGPLTKERSCIPSFISKTYEILEVADVSI